MSKLKYITIEYGRGYQIFASLHNLYQNVHGVVPKDKDETLARTTQLNFLEELLVYLATRLHIEWEKIDEKETKDKDQIEVETKKLPFKEGIVNGNTNRQITPNIPRETV